MWVNDRTITYKLYSKWTIPLQFLPDRSGWRFRNFIPMTQEITIGPTLINNPSPVVLLLNSQQILVGNKVIEEHNNQYLLTISNEEIKNYT